MISDYKGEKPRNVITKEEHQKRPFFKKASFWILSVLGLFFGACSIYGLVLGYQYVDAVRDAAHIIADANSETSESLTKNKSFLPSPTPYASINFSFTNEGGFTGTKLFRLDNGEEVDLNDMPVNVPCFRITCSSSSAVVLCFPFASQNNTQNICLEDYVSSWVHNQTAWQTTGFYHYCPLISSSNPFVCSGVFHYQPYIGGYQTGYSSGYDTGYAEAQNPTTIHLSIAPEYYPQTGSFHYEWYLDGEVQQTGELAYQGSNGWDSVDLYRNPGSTARLVFDRPGTRFIAEYSITAFGNDGGYPALNDTNAYDFDDAIWYIPSYYEDFYLRAQGGSAPAEHYSDTYDIFIDPDQDARAHIGLWDEGYRQGYSDGMEDNGRWQQGWNTGYETGKDEGEIIGYQKGVHDTQSGSKALLNMFVTAFQQPFDQVYRFLNFNLLGINILSLFTALLTLGIGVIVIKKVL